MSPPLSKNHIEILNKEFYELKNLFGRYKLYALIKEKYENFPSRRQIAEWLSQQEINKLYTPSKGKAKTIKSSITTPNTILAIDLVNMEKFEVSSYLFNRTVFLFRY